MSIGFLFALSSRARTDRAHAFEPAQAGKGATGTPRPSAGSRSGDKPGKVPAPARPVNRDKP